MGAALTLLGTVGCDVSPTPGTPASGGDSVGHTVAANVDCVRPEEGCACEPGAPAVYCDLDPIYEDNGHVLCLVGERYCQEDGSWSGCQNIREFTIDPTAAVATNDPLGDCAASLCNPDCGLARDRPTDLTNDGESDGDVIYDPTAGGITLDGGPVIIPGLEDADNDGVPDDADDCPNTVGLEEFFGCPNGTSSYFHVLEPGETATPDPFDIEVNVSTADIYILMDNTGSMGDEITNLRNSLSRGDLRVAENRPGGANPCAAGANTGVIGAVQCKIPNVRIGVGMFREFGPSYGGGDDIAFQHYADVTDNIGILQRAVDNLETNGNVDWPEAATSALYAVATGRGIGDYFPNRTGCPAGTFGYPCFRDGTIPIVLLLTDANMKNGPSRSEYSSGNSSLSGPEDYSDWSNQNGISMPRTIGAALGNDGFDSAFDLGTIGGTSLSVMGSTHNLTNAIDNSQGVCVDQPVTRRVCVENWPWGDCRNESECLATDWSGACTDRRNFDRCNVNVTGTCSFVGGTRPWECPTNASDLQGTCRRFEDRTTIETVCSPPTGACETTARDAVFAFRVDTTRTLTITTEGSSFDTKLAIRRGDFSLVGCNDDNNQAVARNYNLVSAVTATFSPGQTYYAVVDAYNSDNSGSFRLDIRSSGNGGSATTQNFPVAYSTVESALVASGVKVISVISCNTNSSIDGSADSRLHCPHAFNDARQLARDTGSLDPGGNPYVTQINPNGSGMGSAVVDEIAYFADTSRFDVTVEAVPNASTSIAAGFSLNDFIASAMPTTCPNTCLGGITGNSCNDCVAGTTGVAFGVAFTVPAGYPQTMVAQVIEFDVVALGNGSTEFDRVPVRIVIPPGTGNMADPTEGRYSNVYDADDRCDFETGQRPDWRDFTWVMPSSPVPDSTIEFTICSGETEPGIGCSGASFVVPTNQAFNGGPLDISTLLASSGQSLNTRYLRVTATLRSSSDGIELPVLEGWDVELVCFAAE